MQREKVASRDVCVSSVTTEKTYKYLKIDI